MMMMIYSAMNHNKKTLPLPLPLLIATPCYGDQIKQDEMDSRCGRHGREEEYIYRTVFVI